MSRKCTICEQQLAKVGCRHCAICAELYPYVAAEDYPLDLLDWVLVGGAALTFVALLWVAFV